MAELTLGLCRSDPDRAWQLLQHPGLERHPARCRLACHLIQFVLERQPGGGGGRAVRLWMATGGSGIGGASVLARLEDLSPLVIKELEFETTQDHKPRLAALQGLQGDAALLPRYVSLLDTASTSADGSSNVGGGFGQSGGGYGSFNGSFSESLRAGTVGRGGFAGGQGVVFGKAGSQGNQSSQGKGSVGDNDSDVGSVGGADGDNDSDDNDGSDRNSNGGDDNEEATLIQGQTKGKPRDTRTKLDAFYGDVDGADGPRKEAVAVAGPLGTLVGLG